MRLPNLFYYLIAASLFTGGCAQGVATLDHADIINVTLSNVSQYETAEAFSKVLISVNGVSDSKRMTSTIVPNEPQRSRIVWTIALDGIRAHVLEMNIMATIDLIVKNRGQIMINNVMYNYAPFEIDLLRGIFPNSATSMSIDFTVDRERAMEREFSGR